VREKIAWIRETAGERFGISYFSIFDVDVEAFAPVVALLAGT
jgi:hypothetical protein